MWIDEVFERFTQQSPLSAMTRATLEHLFADSFLDSLFDQHAQVQYQKQLTFATLTALRLFLKLALSAGSEGRQLRGEQLQ